MKKELPRNLEIKGIGVSEGIVTGRAYVLSDDRAVAVRRAVPEGLFAAEKERFLKAVEQTKAGLQDIRQEVFKKESLKEHVSIIGAHIAILEDRIVISDTLKAIEKDRINAEWAFAAVMDRFIRHFEKLKDPYLRERKYDLEHLKDRVLKNLTGQAYYDVSTIKSDVILVAFDLSPAETARINTDKVKGIVTEMGSKTSHTAIIAKALNIPALVAAEGILAKVTGGDLLVVDGKKGITIINPDAVLLAEYNTARREDEKRKKTLIDFARLPSVTRDGVHVKMMANIELPEEIAIVKDYGAEGVGLYRTEFIFLNRESPPSEDEHFHIYDKVARGLYPSKVTIRTFDLGGDKVGLHHAKLAEKNPALGLRAVRFCLTERKLFKDQIRGILRASVHGNVRILFPMISSMSELKTVKAIVLDAMKDLDLRQIKFDRSMQIGVMIEVPAAVMIADMLAEEVDFFSIGTNDLIQYTLAIDRSNEYVAHFYDPLNPSILRMLEIVIAAAKKKDIDVSICGEMAGEPMHIPILVGMGFRELSMNPSSLPLVHKALSSISCADAEMLIRRARKKHYLGIDGMAKNIKDLISAEIS